MSRDPSQSGFTLIELLVVLAIISAIAGVGVQALGPVFDQSREALVRAEMNNIAKAIQRFRADTGYWPKEGPFAGDCAVDAAGNLIGDNPAHLGQLRERPYSQMSDADTTCDTDEPILPYDVASGSGWNGPYIRELDAAWVTSGGDLNANGSGNPIIGIETVRGLGDPFNADTTGGFFAWTDADGDPLARLGRPYLYFLDVADDDNDDIPNWADDDIDGDGTLNVGDGDYAIPACQMPCLISMGPNGTYDQGNGDDIVVNIAGH